MEGSLGQRLLNADGEQAPWWANVWFIWAFAWIDESFATASGVGVSGT